MKGIASVLSLAKYNDLFRTDNGIADIGATNSANGHGRESDRM